jgi:hypothetical protein
VLARDSSNEFSDSSDDEDDAKGATVSGGEGVMSEGGVSGQGVGDEGWDCEKCCTPNAASDKQCGVCDYAPTGNVLGRGFMSMDTERNLPRDVLRRLAAEFTERFAGKLVLGSEVNGVDTHVYKVVRADMTIGVPMLKGRVVVDLIKLGPRSRLGSDGNKYWTNKNISKFWKTPRST